MARKRSVALTDGELRLMRVLWDRGAATVGQVVEEVGGPRKPAYNTVLTLLRILERKGYVRHEKAGRAFVFSPVIDRNQARRRAVSQLLSRFFDGSPELLVLNLIEQEQIDQEELRRVRALIETKA